MTYFNGDPTQLDQDWSGPDYDELPEPEPWVYVFTDRSQIMLGQYIDYKGKRGCIAEQALSEVDMMDDEQIKRYIVANYESYNN